MKYECKVEWLCEFTDWVQPLRKKGTLVFCKVCKCSLSIKHNGRHALLHHQASDKHKCNMSRNLKKNQKLRKKPDLFSETQPPRTSHDSLVTTLKCNNLDNARVGSQCSCGEVHEECTRKSSEHVQMNSTPEAGKKADYLKEYQSSTKQSEVSVNTSCNSQTSSPEANICENVDESSVGNQSDPIPPDLCEFIPQTDSKISQDIADQSLENGASEKVGYNDGGDDYVEYDGVDEEYYTPSYYAHLRSLDTCFLASTVSMKKAAEIRNVTCPLEPGKTQTLNEGCNRFFRPHASDDIKYTPVKKEPKCSRETNLDHTPFFLDHFAISPPSENFDEEKTVSMAEIQGVSDTRCVHEIPEVTVSQMSFPQTGYPQFESFLQTGYPQFESFERDKSFAYKNFDVNYIGSSCSTKPTIKTKNENESSTSKTNGQSQLRGFLENNCSDKTHLVGDIRYFLRRLENAKRVYETECRDVMKEFEKFLHPVVSKQFSSYDAILAPEYASSWNVLKLLESLLFTENSERKILGETQLPILINNSSRERKFCPHHTRESFSDIHNSIQPVENEENSSHWINVKQREDDRKRVRDDDRTPGFTKHRRLSFHSSF